MRLIRSALLLLTLLCLPALATDTPDVRKLMTAEEFQAAGLEQLSEQQIEALNTWVIRYTAKDAPAMRAHSEVVREEIKRVEETSEHTRIVGDFKGWYGNSVFTLENGQVWKQRLPGRWFYRATNPEVEIKRNVMGFWVMRVVEADRAIGVTRVK